MTIKTEPTKTDSAPVVRRRSVARGELYRRLADRETAQKAVAEKSGAARRLKMQGETAAALASQLSGLRASAAAKMADHALRGENGALSLASDGREELLVKLADAEALAEAAGPALELVEVEIQKAHVALNAKVAAASALVVPVFEEELEDLFRELQEANAKLIPLRSRLAGLVEWSRENAYRQTEEARAPFFRLMTAATEAARMGQIPSQVGPQGTTTSVWADLASRLSTDADAKIAPYHAAAA